MICPHGCATIAIHTDNQVLASQILQYRSFLLLGEPDLTDESEQDGPFGVGGV